MSEGFGAGDHEPAEQWWSGPTPVEVFAFPDECAAWAVRVPPGAAAASVLALVDPVRISAPGRVDALVGLERLIAWAAARQVQVLAAMADDPLPGGDPAGVGSGNSPNGFTPKTVITTAGQARVEVPRDRNGSVEPQLVPTRRRRLGSTSDMILSLYERGMTTRDIKAHLGEVYGVEVSHETVAKVTDVVIDEVRAWQSRPVDEVYPIVFVDGIRIKVRDSGAVTNKVV